jgi:hypothetical protein
MRRIQIHLEEEVDDALAREALARHTSKAALIREYVRDHISVDPKKSDPSGAFIGAYEGGADESERVDEVVYGE